MVSLQQMVVLFLAILPIYATDDATSLYLMTPRFLVEKMVEEAFDDEIKQITGGRTQRSVINEVDNDICEDQLGTSQCRYLRDFGACYREDMSTRMKSMCRKTCRFCREHKNTCRNTRFGCCPESNTPAKGPNMLGCEDSCVDVYGHHFCKTAKKMNMCALGHGKTFRGCSKTCGHCRPCTDIVPLKCKIALKLNACHALKKTTINYCRKTCGFCGKKDPCFGFVCEFPNQCVVGPNGRPKCMCKRKCSTGDRYTGKLCGRDGLDYKNVCDLKQAYCKRGKEIFAKHFGSCDKDKKYQALKNCSVQKDVYNCPNLVRAGHCKRSKEIMLRLCPHACGFCSKKQAAPKASCYYTKFGCCMDGVTPCTGPGYQGCKPCQDKLKYVCKRFVPACGDENNTGFMKKNCPKQCRYCPSKLGIQ